MRRHATQAQQTGSINFRAPEAEVLAAVQKSLADGRLYADVPDPASGATLLYTACACGHLLVAQFLVKAGANINHAMYCLACLKKTCRSHTERYQYRFATLQIAAQEGRLEIVRWLVEAGAVTDAERGSYPMMAAARNGRLEVVRYLLEAGVDKNAGEGGCGSPLWFAAWSGYAEIVRLLVAAGADVNSPRPKGDSPLLTAARWLEKDGRGSPAHREIVRCLIEAGADVEGSSSDSTTECTPLIAAASCGCREAVELLIAAGASLDRAIGGATTALAAAAKAGSLDVVKCLIEAGANKDALGTANVPAVFIAAFKGHLEVVRYLLESGASTRCTPKENTIVDAAVQSDSLELVQYLIGAGMSLEPVSEGGVTPLQTAADSGKLRFVECLLAAGADKEAATRHGWTALHFAAYKGHQAVVRCLVEAGAPKDARNTPLDATPLFAAAFRGHVETARYLLGVGATDSRLRGNAAIRMAKTQRMQLRQAKTSTQTSKDGMDPGAVAAAEAAMAALLAEEEQEAAKKSKKAAKKKSSIKKQAPKPSGDSESASPSSSEHYCERISESLVQQEEVGSSKSASTSASMSASMSASASALSRSPNTLPDEPSTVSGSAGIGQPRVMGAAEAARLREHLVCPVTQELFVDPVLAGDGFTYERSAIEDWVSRKPTSPMTNEPLPHLTLISNQAVLRAVQSLKEASS